MRNVLKKIYSYFSKDGVKITPLCNDMMLENNQVYLKLKNKIIYDR